MNAFLGQPVASLAVNRNENIKRYCCRPNIKILIAMLKTLSPDVIPCDRLGSKHQLTNGSKQEACKRSKFLETKQFYRMKERHLGPSIFSIIII